MLLGVLIICHVSRSFHQQEVAGDDLGAIRNALSKDALASRPADFWRYRELLPVRRTEHIVSLGEAVTPIIALPKLATKTGGELLVIDPRDGKLERKIALGESPEGVSASRDGRWIAVRFDLALALLCAGERSRAFLEYSRGVHQAVNGGVERLRGVVRVAIDDLDECLAERPALATTREAIAARDLLRSTLRATYRAG